MDNLLLMESSPSPSSIGQEPGDIGIKDFQFDVGKIKLIEAWGFYASVDWVIIGSGNGLSPVRCQAITWTNDELLSN